MQNTRSIRRNGRRYHLPLRGRREKVYPCGFLRLLGRGRIHGTGEQRNDSEDAESELKRGEKIGNLRGGMRGAIRKRISANAPLLVAACIYRHTSQAHMVFYQYIKVFKGTQKYLSF